MSAGRETEFTALHEDERSYLNDTFATLCAIASETRHERACADWCAAELRALGLEVTEDAAGKAIGGTAGNLLTRIAGAGAQAETGGGDEQGGGDGQVGGAAGLPARSILLCAHLDTVPLTAPVQPVVRDGYFINANDSILGADNKAAVAAILTVARRLTGLSTPPAVGVEILLTVAEEDGLCGASEFDATQLRSDYGYVFDHASPLGEVITASPTYVRIDARLRGLAAHAGLHPELGVNAIVAAAQAITALPNGRLDPETTANVGVIAGGSATNVVPDHCRVQAEVRSLDEPRLDIVVRDAIDALQDAADSGGCDLDLGLARMFTGYRVDPGERSLRAARAALAAIGYECTEVASGGGSDANALRVAGFACTNLANGTERAHQRDERVSVRALADNARLMLALIEQAALAEPPASVEPIAERPATEPPADDPEECQ